MTEVYDRGAYVGHFEI